MTTYFVDSADGVNDFPATDGESWANCFADVDYAFDNVPAGSIIKVDWEHSKTYGGIITYSSPGTASQPVLVYSVDRDDSDAYRIGALEETPVGSGTDILLSGYAILYGMTIQPGDALKIFAANISWKFVDSHINMPRDNTFSGIDFEGAGSSLVLENTDITMGATGQQIIFVQGGCVFEWLGGTLNSNLDVLFYHSDEGGMLNVRGVDLSSISGAGQYLIDGWGVSSDDSAFVALFTGCKLAAVDPPGLVKDATVVRAVHAKMIGCSSGNTPYFQEHMSEGDVYHESSIVRAGEDPSANTFSAKMVTSVNATYDQPLRYKLGKIWTNADPIITVYLTHNDLGAGTGNMFETHQAWIEVEQPQAGNAAFKDWDRSTKASPLVTGVDQGTDYAGTKFTNSEGLDQSIVAILGGGAAGWHIIWACLGVASLDAVYWCPQIDVSY